jgi:dUTP pyrophosphatase
MDKILIRYHDDELEKIGKIAQGDWIDLRAAETVSLKAGEHRIISLGVSMRLPDGYEAHILPRSSTFKKWGILQTNHMGIIDNSYSGDNDIWCMSVLAMRDTLINKNDRICQFRIMEQQPEISFEEVTELTGPNRGGHGSTGKQ